MKLKVVIKKPDIEWQDFKELISSNTDLSLFLKACYNKSKRRRAIGFSRKAT